jgi:four helix bundle protein
MPNGKAQMSNEARNANDEKKYDFEERTAQFGEAVLELTRTLPRDPVNTPLISQMAIAGTSIGANCVEADGAESNKDFQHKIPICRKESKETKQWLRMIIKANPGRRDEGQKLSREAQQLGLIFSSILPPKKRQF